MTKMRRVQVLFENDQYQKLAEIAKREGTSISFQVRLAVDQWLARQGDKQQKIGPAVDNGTLRQDRDDVPRTGTAGSVEWSTTSR